MKRLDRAWRQTDIARYLGVSRLRAPQLSAEGRLPAPAGEDKRGHYWDPGEVRAWARRWVKERPLPSEDHPCPARRADRACSEATSGSSR